MRVKNIVLFLLMRCFLRWWYILVVIYYVHRYGGRFVENRYGAGSGQIWLDEVMCNGTEASITDCQHNGWGNTDCAHSEDVSVACTSGIVPSSSQLKRYISGFLENVKKTSFILEIPFCGTWYLPYG